jgi:hypothetical protein
MAEKETDAVRVKLVVLADLLVASGDGPHARLVTELVQESKPNTFWAGVNSNETWGGSGSVADQASNPRITQLLTDLGQQLLQLQQATNPRLPTWVEIFSRQP